VQSYDVIVIGGGIAGVSIGYELAADRRVALLDMESTLAFHTTGRSAATFLESYGNAAIRSLTTASREFLENPPDVVESQLLSPLAMLHVGTTGRGDAVRRLHSEVEVLVSDVELIDAAAVRELQPLMRADWVELALLEPGAMEVDVHALHQGFARGLRQRKGEIAVSARIVAAESHGRIWTVTDAAGRSWTAPVVVNAAGAWADEVAALFGARRIGLRPLRRSAFMVDAPDGAITKGSPMIADIDDTFYFKPEPGQFLCSPADETLQEPGDARPDELEIARAIEAINEATTMGIRSVRSSWAGLRNFVVDRTPVVGYDPVIEGLFWYAAQGGYGIQTAPALARSGAALLRHESLPADVVARQLIAATLAPDRPGLG